MNPNAKYIVLGENKTPLRYLEGPDDRGFVLVKFIRQPDSIKAFMSPDHEFKLPIEWLEPIPSK